MKKNVLSIIVTHNSSKWIEKCIRSIFESSFQSDIFIIDNASSDNTIEIIENIEGEKVLIKNENVGFAKANNTGIKYALENNYEGILLLNHDAWLEKNTLEQLVKTSESNNKAGIISPIHLNGNGELLDFNFTNYISQPNDEGRNLYTDLLVDRELKPFYFVNYVNAACWYLPITVIQQCGNFDHILFPHYGEDDNFISRVKHFDFHVCIVPTAFIFHDREERMGKQTKNPFTKNHIIQKFIRISANCSEEDAKNHKQQTIKAIKRNCIKHLIKFNLAIFLQELKLYKELKQLSQKVSEHRELYHKGHLF